MIGLLGIGWSPIECLLAPTRRLFIITHELSGFMGGLAGLSIVAQAGSASASVLGSDRQLPCIAASLIGGTSISGG